ncbi:pre-rRNA processing [Taxawa tesnikishii (nom. ined.)]|nr:pre-rRNA processing [Dothideales sp. JES 119]
MELDVSYSLENEQQFWDELQDIVSVPCETHELIDNALRTFLSFTTAFKGLTGEEEYLHSEYDIARCCSKLLESNLFRSNRDYVRRQFVYVFLQEDEVSMLHVMAVFLLFDGRSEETTFEMMQTEGAFPRLVELIRSRRDDDRGLHRLLIELLYEMSRIQRLSWEDLRNVDDAFIMYLFQLIEELSDDANDPYHYPLIRVLLVLNEQYMCFAHAPAHPTAEQHRPLTNRIIKILSNHGPNYRTFGENLILLLNRESSLGPQLLILKLLYLLFTTPPTFEYFYTNDLYVLVDVIMRNLLDLDPDARGNQYKRDELRKLLHLLVNSSSMHFAPVDDTVVRLVSRCRQVPWLKEETDQPTTEPERTLTASPPTETDVAKKLLGMNLAEAGESSLSVLEVAAKVEKERPMVPAPRRRKKRTQDSVTHQAGPASGGDSNGDIIPKSLSPPHVADPSEEGGRSPFDDTNNE